VVRSDIFYDPLGRGIKTLQPPETWGGERKERITQILPFERRLFDENDADPESPYFGTPLVHFEDGLGRLVKVHEVARLTDEGEPGPLTEWETGYEYDLNDQLTRITDSQNNVKTFKYDGLKRKIFMNDPDRGVMHFMYDAASYLVETEDAKGQRISYTYDGANRIHTEDYHDETDPFSTGFAYDPRSPVSRDNRPDVAYFYDAPVANLDQGDTTTATARNTRGALATVWDLSGEEHNSFDERGRVEWTVKRIPDPLFLSLSRLGKEGLGEAGLVSYKTGFEYDSLDRLINLTYPDADQLSYQYNNRSLLQRIPGGPSGSIIAGVAYQPSGQMNRIDYGNRVRTTYGYDPRLRLKRLHTQGPTEGEGQVEGADLIHFLYDFDGVSNIKSIADLRPGSAVPEGDPRRNTQLFQYDDLYRLTRVQYSFALPGAAPRNDGEINYRYDRIGNMRSKTSTLGHQEKGLPVANLGDMDSGGTAGRWNRRGRERNDPPGPHTLTTIRNPQFATRNYPYDANGNMTNIDGLACNWDFKDRLVAVENDEMRAAYTYDYTGNRIIKDVTYKPGSENAKNNDPRITTLYINKYFEVREHDVPAKYVWNGNTRVARVAGSLNTNFRIQRLRLWRGWNLCSLAVTGSLFPFVKEGHGEEVIQSAFRWSSTTQGWESMATDTTVPAGTVLWLKASTNATLTVTGSYTEPTNRTVPAGGNFLPSAGLEDWKVKPVISNLPAATAWTYDAFSSDWLSWLASLVKLPSELPAFIAPGEAVFVRADSTARLAVPDSALRIRYYHQDHLGSSCFTTDSAADCVQETAYYPFGDPRNDTIHQDVRETYSFAQKEMDAESSLAYFEARFLKSSLARFASVDPMSTFLTPTILMDPQRFNGINYSRNNPFSYKDPSGTVVETVIIDLPVLVSDVLAFSKNPSGLNAAAFAVDLGLTLVPGIPAGAGPLMRFGAKGTLEGGKIAVDTAKNIRKGDDKLIAFKNSVEAWMAGKVVQKRLGNIMKGRAAVNLEKSGVSNKHIGDAVRKNLDAWAKWAGRLVKKGNEELTDLTREGFEASTSTSSSTQGGSKKLPEVIVIELERSKRDPNYGRPE
jgi:RHS repeat-associated protein